MNCGHVGVGGFGLEGFRVYEKVKPDYYIYIYLAFILTNTMGKFKYLPTLEITYT
jgi:hypothetical protein